MKRSGIIIGSILMAGMLVGILSPAGHAEVRFVAGVNRTQVALEEPFTYTVEISGVSGSRTDPVLPQMNGFDIYSSGRTQSFSLVNGRMSSSVIFNYTLVPKKVGSLTIGPATLEAEGKVYRTEPITITVTAPSSSPPPARSGPGRQSTPSRYGKHHLFVTAELSQDTIYINQSVTLTFRFYRGERLHSSPEFRPPSLAGFWKEDLPPQRRYYRTIKGVQYDVTEIQYALFPISAGETTIDAFSLTAMVPDERSRSRRDPFGLFDDDFFSVFRQGKPLTLTTKPLDLVVLPLPQEGQPADFSGLVGSFDITARYDRTAVAVNEPITAKVTISGRGNIKSITEPKVLAPPDFRLYNAGSEENVSKAGYKVSGSKTFEEVFVPRRAGTYELPAFTLTYFDPNNKQYITRHTQPMTVTVTPGEAEFSIPPRAAEANEIGYLAKDIRFLKSRGEPFTRTGSGFLYVLFGLLHIVPLTGLAVVILARRHKDRLESDAAYRRARYAQKTARRRLDGAQKLIGGGSAHEFYPAISASLADYLGDRFNRSGKGLTRSDIVGMFAAVKIDQDLVNEFIAVLDACDQARFAPGASSAESMRDLYKRALIVLEKLDKAWQKQ